MSLPKPYYEHAGITIYHGDCRDILPHLPKVDLVLTDPPYGINCQHSGNSGKGGQYRGMASRRHNTNPVLGDDQPFDPVFVTQQYRKVILFGADHFLKRLPDGGMFHVWDKDPKGRLSWDSFSDAELFWTSWTCARRCARYLWKGLCQEGERELRYHPTQKPVELMKFILNEWRKFETILDPFMGSGTTLVAAKQLGRQAIGIELEERYCEIAAMRLSQDLLPFEQGA